MKKGEGLIFMQNRANTDVIKAWKWTALYLNQEFQSLKMPAFSLTFLFSLKPGFIQAEISREIELTSKDFTKMRGI